MAEGGANAIEITKPGILALGKGLPSKQSTAALFADNTITHISCGNYHSAVVLASGQVYVFGKNQDDRWVEQDMNLISPPRLVTSLAHVKVVQVACGFYYTLFLTDKGDVYACGRNEYGQLGLGHTDKFPVPQLVTGLQNIKKVSAGAYHSLALAENGKVWAAGCNSEGQLGFTPCGKQVSFICVPEVAVIVDVACGGLFSALLTETRVILVAGNNNFGQLGLSGKSYHKFTPVSTSSVVIAALSCGWAHTVCLLVDGSAWAWGDNSHCQLGDRKLKDNFTKPTPVDCLDGQTITEVFASGYHTALVTSEGEVLLFGRGESGELGNSTKENICVPTLLKKSPELVVKQVVFAETYTLLLIERKQVEIETVTEQKQSKGLEQVETVAEQKQRKEKTQRASISEMEQAMMKSLECPICFKVMCAPIHQCTNGHSVCSSCQTTTSTCSLCREPYINTRSLNLENLSTTVHLPCMDCLERMPANLLDKHDEVCVNRKYDCPVKQPCGWKGRPENMLAHTSSSHPEQTWQTLPHLFVIDMSDNKASRTYLLSAHDEVFTFHLRYDKNVGKMQAVTRYIGSPDTAKQFKVQIALIKADDCDAITFLKNVCVDTENIDLLYESSSSVSVNKEQFDSYVYSNKFVCEVDLLTTESRYNYIKNLLQKD